MTPNTGVELRPVTLEDFKEGKHVPFCSICGMNCVVLLAGSREGAVVECDCGRNKALIPAKEQRNFEQQVAHQEHYTQFQIQVMEFCQVNKIQWCAANVIKYVCRWEKKDGLKDLYKAMDYLKCLIHYKETGTFLPPDKLSAKKGEVK